MYAFLVVALLATAAIVWLSKRFRLARHWNKIYTEAAKARQSGDLAAAERLLQQAEAFATAQSGALWRMRIRAGQSAMAKVLYRAGQLDRSAELTFEQLQQARAVL